MVFLVCTDMNNSKLLFLPPLLVSILLFTISNLKLGLFLNNTTALLLSPITKPTLASRLLLNQQTKYLQSLPQVNLQNREQKILIAHLVWENEKLKQILKDTKTEELLKTNYQKVLPLNITNTTGKIIATSTQSLNQVKPGMPVVLENILLGLVSDISDESLTITTLQDDVFPAISLKSASGPKGVYRHINGSSIMTNVPSQTPLILGDFVLSEATDLIPANLLVGKVTKILTNPQDPIQKGEVTLYETIQHLSDNIVVILKP